MNPSTHKLGAHGSGPGQQELRTGGGSRFLRPPPPRLSQTWQAALSWEAEDPGHTWELGDPREQTTQGARQHPSREAVSAPHSPGLLR